MKNRVTPVNIKSFFFSFGTILIRNLPLPKCCCLLYTECVLIYVVRMENCPCMQNHMHNVVRKLLNFMRRTTQYLNTWLYMVLYTINVSVPLYMVTYVDSYLSHSIRITRSSSLLPEVLYRYIYRTRIMMLSC